MKRLFMLAVVLLTGCGSASVEIEAGNCSGVDTSRTPDSIVRNGNQATYTWGACVRVFVVGEEPK